MELREAQPGDGPAIRDVARRSLQTSYSLDPRSIMGAVEEWYNENRLNQLIDDEDRVLLVIEADEQVVGFSESEIVDGCTGEILWLHVDPDYRGEGYGKELYQGTRDWLKDLQSVATLHGRVLADNADGNAFYESRGLTKVGEEKVEIDGQTHVENVYAELEVERMKEIEHGDDVVYVDKQTTETGSMESFHVVYESRETEEIYGYWCGCCESLANAMDASGRIRCDDCGNARKPTRWDAAYL